MDEILRKSLLFDFYGEMLSERQKEIYEAVVFDDLSLSEVATDYSISRQSVFDMIKRCNNTLEEYENKLGLVEKFVDIKKLAKQIDDVCENIKSLKDKENLSDKLLKNVEKIENITKGIIDDL